MSGATNGGDFLYILRTDGAEDLLKVGITNNPLVRWSSFHSRWFEVFDLGHTILVEAERRSDAQALETTLHRRLKAHGCPIPMTMRLEAGGETEWYRGANLSVSEFVAECQAGGYTVHEDARRWLVPVMHAQRDALDTVLRHAHLLHCEGLLSSQQRERLQALLDANRSFDPAVKDCIPVDQCLDMGLRC